MITNERHMQNKYPLHAALARVGANNHFNEASHLITAARSNDIPQLRMLLDGTANVNAQDESGWTALHWAIKNRHAAAATALVNAGAGAEIEARDGWTAMALAVKTGSPTIIEIAMQALDKNRLTQ